MPEAEAVLLPALQEVHWTIHRAFSEYQRIGEDRRHLAAEIGELIAQFTAELVAAGWSEDAARNADVHQLAAVPCDERHPLGDGGVSAPAPRGVDRARGDRADQGLLLAGADGGS